MDVASLAAMWAFQQGKSAVVAAAVVLLGGCVTAEEPASVVTELPRSPASSEPASPPAAPPVVPGRPSASPTATPSVERRADDSAPTGPVTLAFGGDVHFEGELDAKVRNSPDTMLEAIAPTLSAADVAVVNLETAVTEGGVPSPKEFNFAAPAQAFTALHAAGVDVASVANNHGMDFGRSGLEDTLSAAQDAGFPLIGAGRNAQEAYSPWITTVEGRTVAVIGATQVLDTFALEAWVAGPDKPGLASAKEQGIERLIAAVEEAETGADTVVVFLHWGREGDTCPLPRQPELAQELVSAGADIVVGGHAHRLQGAGFLGDSYVAYGLGNFIFYARPGPGSDSGVLLITIEPDDTLRPEWVPARISGGVPEPLTGAAAQSAVQAWNDLRGCTGLSDQSS